MNNSPAYSLREIVELFFHDWRPIALAFALPLAAAIALAFSLGCPYQASATLLARMGQEYLYRGPTGDGAPIGFEREQSLKSEIAILTSRDLAEKTVQALGPARLYPGLGVGEAVDALLAGLDAQLLKESNVIQVSFRHADPALAADVVNRLVALYLDRRRDLYADSRSDALEGEVKRYKQRLAELERKAELFKRTNAIVSLSEERALLLRQRVELDAKVKSAANTLAEASRRLVQARANVGAAERVGRLSVLDAAESDVLKLQAEESSAIAAHAVQSEQLEQLDVRITALARAEREMDQINRELALAADTYQTYARKLEEARIADLMEHQAQANMRLVQAARPPSRPVSYRSAILAVGAAVSLLSALLTAFLLDWRRATLLTPEAVERGLGIPVLAECPETGARP